MRSQAELHTQLTHTHTLTAHLHLSVCHIIYSDYRCLPMTFAHE